MRISNIHQHKKPVMVSMYGSFHGRTESPSKVSGSCQPKYQQHLQEYRDGKVDNVRFMEYNNLDSCRKAFEQMDQNGEFPEITLFEPVQGEGNPGQPMDRSFYDLLRQQTAERGGLLLADSVQAGLRCQGVLSITKYPGFEDIVPPDMETFSKAINGGQYPLSVLAMSDQVAEKYQTGLYGNTMTTNPRALEVAIATMEQLDIPTRSNIVTSGKLFLEKLQNFGEKYQNVGDVKGTGLLLSMELDPKFDVLEVEMALRQNGLNVIHGGKNALRFTPWFKLNEPEMDLMIEIMENSFDQLGI
jgi:acetylornithine/succinyldiaminopimelate/putrescine aminotransferase